LKWEEQARLSAAKGNKILGILKKTFVSRDTELWRKLFTSLVRPHLEYAVQVWNPYLEKDIEVIEKVQRRSSKVPDELKNLEYEERLKRWGLTTLTVRRVRGDAIQIYKHINNIEKINWHKNPKFAPVIYGEGVNRACKNQNSLAIQRETFPSRNVNDFCHFVNVRHHFLINRVSEFWNKLPETVIKAPTLNSFKARLDEIQQRLL